jgi:hypothetical protein
MKKCAYLVAFIVIAAAGATWFYERREIDRQKSWLATERSRASRLQQQLVGLQQQRDEALHTAAEAEHDLHSHPPAETATAVDPVRTDQIAAWSARLKRVKQSFTDLPTQAIPELKLLTDLDWLSLARTLPADSDLDLKKARSAARALAIPRFTRSLGAALRDYTAANDGNLPTDITQLIPFFKTPADPDILQRYVMTGSGNVRTMKGEAIGERAPVDEDLDPYYSVSATGGSASGSRAKSHYDRAAFQALGDFGSANKGQSAKTVADLLPYVRDQTVRPIIEARVRFEAENRKRSSTFEQLRPYVTDAAAAAFLEKLIATEQRNPSP